MSTFSLSLDSAAVKLSDVLSELGDPSFTIVQSFTSEGVSLLALQPSELIETSLDGVTWDTMQLAEPSYFSPSQMTDQLLVMSRRHVRCGIHSVDLTSKYVLNDYTFNLPG